MATTFIFGNGFDLNLGMNTRYSDFYNVYIESPSNSDNIRRFKNMLRKDKPNKYVTWANFEEQMGKSAKEFDTEEDFVECARDFRENLSYYLEDEQKRFNDLISFSGLLDEELENMFFNFYNDLVDRYSRVIYNIYSKDSTKHFITFNYTNTLEKLISTMKNNNPKKVYLNEEPIHIHDTLERGIVVGVDNDSQLDTDNNFEITDLSKYAFIKPEFNSLVNDNIVSEAEICINSSSVLCIFGLSLGDSDLYWKNKIRDWLKASPSHHIVYYIHSKKQYNTKMRDIIIADEKKEKNKMLKNLFGDEEYIKYLNQVHIPLVSNVYNIKYKIKDINHLSKLEKAGKEAVINSMRNELSSLTI